MSKEINFSFFPQKKNKTKHKMPVHVLWVAELMLSQLGRDEPWNTYLVFWQFSFNELIPTVH